MLRPKAYGVGVEPAGGGIGRLAGVDPDRRDPQVQKPRQVGLDLGLERRANAVQRTGNQPFIDPVVVSPRARFRVVRISGERASGSGGPKLPTGAARSAATLEPKGAAARTGRPRREHRSGSGSPAGAAGTGARWRHVGGAESRRDVRRALQARARAMPLLSALRGGSDEGRKMPFLDRRREPQPASPRHPPPEDVQRRQTPSISERGCRFRAAVRGNLPSSCIAPSHGSPVQHRRDFPHPHASLLMLHLHDRLVRPVEVERENGYLLAELGQGVAGDSPRCGTSIAKTWVHLGHRASIMAALGLSLIAL